jgi:MerR family mercuric resistance operon transcriptional regulator
MPALATISRDSLAKQAGIDVAAVRIYERMGLISKPRSAAGGLKLYRTEDVTRLTFIRRAMELGFSIDAIREFLQMTTCKQIHRAAQRHLTDIRRRLADLSRLESALAPLVSSCPKRGSAAQCPIVNALSQPA